MLANLTQLIRASLTVLMSVAVVNGPWKVTLVNATCSASSTSKILVCVTQTLSPVTSGSSTFGGWICLRGSTTIYTDARINMYMQYAHSTYSCFVLDSPATTSATTYKTQMVTGNASYTIEAQHGNLRTSTISLLEIAA